MVVLLQVVMPRAPTPLTPIHPPILMPRAPPPLTPINLQLVPMVTVVVLSPRLLEVVQGEIIHLLLQLLSLVLVSETTLQMNWTECCNAFALSFITELWV